MNCKKCGSPLVPEDKFCKLCGTPVVKESNVGMTTPLPSNTPSQPMNPTSTPTPIKVDNPPTPVKVGGPVGMNQPATNVGPKPDHGMKLEETQVLGTVPGIKQNVGAPTPVNKPTVAAPVNKPTGMVANSRPVPSATGPIPKPVSPAPVPGMPMSNNNVAPEPESKGGALKVVLIILLILGLAVGGYFGYKALSDKDNGGGEDESSPVVSSTKKVDFGGYTFEIPTKFMVQVGEEEMLNVDDGTFGFYMDILDYSYSQINPTKSVANYTNMGYTAEYVGEKDYSGTKYHMFRITESGESVYVVFTKLGATKLLGLTIYNNPASVLPTQGNVDEALNIGLSGTYSGTHNLEKDGLDKFSPKIAIFGEEAKKTGDVSNYTEENSYADVTVEEIY